MNDITYLTVLTPGQPAGTVAPPNVMPPSTVFANPSTQWATPINMTFGDLTLELGLFTAVDRGVVPPSGGGTQNFLRADGTWSPAGLGNITGPALMGTTNAIPGPPVPLTPAQFTSMMNLFTATASGAVPASGGGTANYLRADGTWSVPDADGPLPAGTVWGNPMGAPGPGMAMTPAMVTPLLDLFTTTTRGLVPPSGAGVNSFLRGDGTWALPPESAPIPPFTVLGNFSPATAVPSPVTTTQLTSMIDLFTATESGAVPASGGGINNFLRADGVWTSPPGLAPIPGPAVLGNESTTPGVPHALSQAQLTGMLNLFTATTRGIVPASGGGSERFLRADGVWADVPEFPLPLGHEDWPLVGRGTLPSTYRQLTAEGIRDDAVTNDKLRDMPAATIKGNLGPNIGVHDLSGSEVTSMLRLFTTTTQGVVPPSTNLGFYLRGDGTWHDIDMGALAPIPNDTFIGNISGGTAIPVAIPFSSLPVPAVFTQTTDGSVPAPLTAPLNAALQADGTWKVPGTNYKTIVGASYTALPTDDVLLMYFLPNVNNLNTTLTLPNTANVPDGKRLRVLIQFGTGGPGNLTPTGCSLTIAPGAASFITPGVNTLIVLAPSAFSIIPQLVGPEDPIYYQALIVKIAGNYWYMVNEAMPIPYTLGGFPGILPGLMPGPPAGTATNAALQADMTWRVPGSAVQTITAGNYQALPTDDMVIFNPVTGSVEFRLPGLYSVNTGKRITLIIRNIAAGSELTIQRDGASTDELRVLLSSGWSGLGGLAYVIPGAPTNTFSGTQISFQADGSSWYLRNEGPPLNGTVSGTPFPLPGLTS